jgi:uncharacterized phage protein gp47/JayE
MALTTPTTQELADTIVASIEAAISQSVPFLPKTFCRVLAKAFAGTQILLWKYAGFIFLQLFVAYATMDETEVNGKKIRPLLEWGRLIGAPDPEPATRAELVIDVVVTNQTGYLKASTPVVRTESGVVYVVAFDVPLNAATVKATIRASSTQSGGDGSGSIGNLAIGDEVAFASPQNVAPKALVSAVAKSGADAESTDSYRGRVIRRFQNKPQGGAYADYQQWAEEVAGIVHAYPYTGAPGEVDVYCEATVDSSGSPDGIPTSGQLTAVEDSCELDVGGLASRRPASTAVNALAIRRTAFNVLVRGLEVTDLSGTVAAIEAGVDEHLRSREPFIVGLSVLPRQDRITQAAVSSVVDTIVGAAGGTVAAVQLLDGTGGVMTARSLGKGEKARLGVITYEG